jgi:tetratricopeptide (TPR) repeat protein
MSAARTRMLRSLLCLLVAAPLAGADMLALKDGRFLDGLEISKVETGFRVHYPSGTVDIPAGMVADYFPTDETGEFIPRTEEEREMLAKGRVPWRGRWISKTYRDKLVRKELAARRKRIEQQKERRLWRNRAIVKTKRFIFQHTLPDEVFAELKDLFEVYFETFTKEWGVRPSARFGKVTINIYHDAEYYYQVSGAPKGAVGWYMPRDRDLHFYFDREQKRFTIDVMFHETNHMLTHMVNDDLWYPAWLNEGMAEYYGASEWDPEAKTMTTGRLQSARLAVLLDLLEGESLQGLETLIQTSRIDATQYAWAWSLCHFLMTHEKYAKRFRKYFLALGRSPSIKTTPAGGMRIVPPAEQIKALKRYLKIKDLGELERDWHDYVRNDLANRSDLDWEGAGARMMLLGQYRQARKFYKKAIELGSESAFVYHDYARLQFNLGKVKIPLKYLERALALDPLRARAWGLRARCLYRQGKKKEAERLFALASEMDPEDPILWLWQEEEKQLADEGKGPG